ncbi:TolR protein [Desulfovibrio litoralis DSM 11393]|uniref:TolR protein n=1 Tax=Desulfovibrio litoralis DSM 11393 TaxID=1121455 RepID=A0A1M7RVX7_9BACT|nr:TolR protein [Desulfovibrio litoralis DSM 11393]
MGVSVSRKGGFVAEINVTPFVDVMLVLLIIFMVTAPLMTEGLQVDLPQTQTVEVLPTDSDHMVLTIRKDGVMFLDEYQVNQETLIQQLLVNVKEKNKQLFLQADKEVPYGVVVDVMGRIRAAGVEKLGVVAEKPSDAEGMSLGGTVGGGAIGSGTTNPVQTNTNGVNRPLTNNNGGQAQSVQVSPSNLNRNNKR